VAGFYLNRAAKTFFKTKNRWSFSQGSILEYGASCHAFNQTLYFYSPNAKTPIAKKYSSLKAKFLNF
jgi:hypothetical protein